MIATPMLLTVIEVPESEAVKCQAEGCGRRVHRRIHVVRMGASLQVLGSDCFDKLHGKTAGSPHFGGGGIRTLSADERELLVMNTERLVEQLKAEWLVAQRASHPRQSTVRRSVSVKPPALLSFRDWHQSLPPDDVVAVDLLVREEKERLHAAGIDPDLPGNAGMVGAAVWRRFEECK